MSKRYGAWAIQLGAAAAPRSFFLVQADDGQTSWTGHGGAALRFASKAAADRFARSRLAGDVVITNLQG